MENQNQHKEIHKEIVESFFETQFPGQSISSYNFQQLLKHLRSKEFQNHLETLERMNLAMLKGAEAGSKLRDILLKIKKKEK